MLKVFLLVFLLEIEGISLHTAFGLSLHAIPAGEFPFIGLLSESTGANLSECKHPRNILSRKVTWLSSNDSLPPNNVVQTKIGMVCFTYSFEQAPLLLPSWAWIIKKLMVLVTRVCVCVWQEAGSDWWGRYFAPDFLADKLHLTGNNWWSFKVGLWAVLEIREPVTSKGDQSMGPHGSLERARKTNTLGVFFD